MADTSVFSGYFGVRSWQATTVQDAPNTDYGEIGSPVSLLFGLDSPPEIGYLSGFPFASYSSCPLISTPVAPSVIPSGTVNPYPLGEPYTRESYNLILRMIRMDTFQFSAQVLSGTTPVDISANTLRFTAKWSLRDDDVDAVISKVTGAGIDITDGVNGRCLVTIDSSDTSTLPLHETTLFYDLQMTDILGRRYTVLYGQLIIRPDVTQI